jgi:hypothetical protein
MDSDVRGFIDMNAMQYPRRALPAFARVAQHLPDDHLADVRGTVRQKLQDFGLKLKAGAKVGITAGSRGIGGFAELLLGIVDAVKAAGGEPFIFPAMGSHGGATCEGQTEILRRLGVTEASIGVPVKATMETVTLGTAENGAKAHLDRDAFEADGIIVLGRTKTHPECTGPLASGLLKMCTVGLGKQQGAQEAHNHGLWESVRAVPRVQLAQAKILCGVAVVENGYRQPALVEIVPPVYDAFLEADERLLNIAKQHLARIPFDDLDVLIVDELGKNISGGGMDPNIIGKWRNSDAPHIPDYRRIVVLSLTGPSLGNGLGIGMADFTTERFMKSYDPAVTYVNLLTAQEPGGNTREGPTPLALPSDREAMEVALYSSLAGAAPRLCRIKSTAELDQLWVSEALLDEVKYNPKLELLDKPAPMPFDSQGNAVRP